MSLALPPDEKRLLFSEMTAFEVAHGKNAMMFAAGSGAHDDLVLALALGVFGARLSDVSREALRCLASVRRQNCCGGTESGASSAGIKFLLRRCHLFLDQETTGVELTFPFL